MVGAELGPPRGPLADEVLKTAESLKGYVDTVNLADNQGATLRMSSLATAILARQAGLDGVMQLTCRDKNRLALQAEVIGAQAFGISNFMGLSGDHQSLGDHPFVKGAFDVDSMQLVALLKRMRDEGVNAAGGRLEGSFGFLIGAAVNPFAPPFEFRPLRLRKKIEAGADFVMSQIVYNVPRFKSWMQAVRDEGLHERVAIIAGVGPLRSLRAAEFMRDHVAGMDVPEEILKRLQGADKPRVEGRKICVEIVQQLKEIPGVAGVHIMSTGWEEAVPRVVEEAGLLPRPVVDDVSPASAVVPAHESR